MGQSVNRNPHIFVIDPQVPNKQIYRCASPLIAKFEVHIDKAWNDVLRVCEGFKSAKKYGSANYKSANRKKITRKLQIGKVVDLQLAEFVCWPPTFVYNWVSHIDFIAVGIICRYIITLKMVYPVKIVLYIENMQSMRTSWTKIVIDSKVCCCLMRNFLLQVLCLQLMLIMKVIRTKTSSKQTTVRRLCKTCTKYTLRSKNREVL